MYTCVIAGNSSDFVGERTKKYQNIVVDAFLTIQSALQTTHVSCTRLPKCILIHNIFVFSEILTRNNSTSPDSFSGRVLHRTERSGTEGAKYIRNLFTCFVMKCWGKLFRRFWPPTRPPELKTRGTSLDCSN
jgi:hypothetical protein